MKAQCATRGNRIQNTQWLAYSTTLTRICWVPGRLLAAFGGRADLRLMVYAGKEMGAQALPNLRKPLETIRGAEA